MTDTSMFSPRYVLVLGLASVVCVGGCAAGHAPAREPGHAQQEAPPRDAPTEPESEPDASPPSTVELTLFFADDKGVAERCDAVASVTRTVEPQPDIATQAIGLLLAGPTEAEMASAGVLHTFGNARHTHLPELRDLGEYFTGVEVVADVAYVDFSEEAAAEYFLYDAACAQATVHAPIAATLRAVVGATKVQYRIAGRVVTEEGGA